jgi:hypothetical protein
MPHLVGRRRFGAGARRDVFFAQATFFVESLRRWRRYWNDRSSLAKSNDGTMATG